MNFLKNIALSAKIFGGFGSVLALLVVVAGFAWFGLSGASSNFKEYRSLAIETNQAGRVQANLLLTRLNAKTYIKTPNASTIDAVKTRAAATLNLATELEEMATSADYVERANKVQDQMQTYSEAFEKVTLEQAKRDDLVNNTLNVNGPQMERNLSAIMQSAFDDNDAASAFRAGKTLRNLLLARLYVFRYLTDNDQASYDRVMQEVQDFKAGNAELIATLKNPVRRNLTTENIELQAAYETAFEGVFTAISNRNELIKNTMDVIGPEIADDIERMKLDVKAQQDELGPNATAEMQQALIFTLVVSAIALALGAAAAWFIGLGITNPIVAMTNAMKSLAQGEIKTDIPATDHKDEIGSMAEAVQVFKDNMVERERLEAQQAEQTKIDAEREEKVRLTAEEATKKEALEEENRQKARKQEMVDLADQFEEVVMAVVNEVASSVTKMESAATEMSNIASTTSEQSSSVSSTAEQTAGNVTMVASATEELSASIREISSQATIANDVVDKAVQNTETAASEVTSLVEASESVTNIVELINDIAEQTNLLALNATIEAARAGDAGKGFAVVATEVKSLASQTGQATEDIRQQMTTMQDIAGKAQTGMVEVNKSMNNINDTISGISAAITEQDAATQGIAENVQEVSDGTTNVTTNIVSVNQGAETTGVAANQVIEALGSVNQQTKNLRTEVESFIERIRSA